MYGANKYQYCSSEGPGYCNIFVKKPSPVSYGLNLNHLHVHVGCIIIYGWGQSILVLE